MEKIRKTTMLIGHNDGDAGVQLMSSEKIRETIARAIARHYDGATLSDARGMWRGSWENSTRVEILFSAEAKDYQIMEELKKALNQNAIYYEVAEVNAAFV